jgi:mono/diheme cytochrome c family protein
MISARMRVLVLAALAAAVIVLSGCGSENIAVPTSNPLHQGAVLFNQRCAGCHTFSYAATHGSAANVRSAQPNNGPNFDIRCERPIARVLYAIENGGFSGAYMPQNVVVGAQAVEVAKFVATYSGRHAPLVPGTKTCQQENVGSVPAFTQVAATATTTTTTAAPATAGKHKRAKKKTSQP